ncbi:MAG: glycosyltransferase [Rikenellaceae bacterium]|nr:glycosyltransferase [Rikenellaceae bacterium]
MNIVIESNSVLPVSGYGGTERVVWYLGKELAKMGHRVTFLAKKGSYCDFARIVEIDSDSDIAEQIPADTDIIHFNSVIAPRTEFPHIVTIHGNITDPNISANAVFVSRDHALRHSSESYVYNGLDWDDYGTVQLDNQRKYFHFLGKAAWRVKNVKDAIGMINSIPGGRLMVLGGTRINLKMGFRFTTTPKAKFFGMVGGEEKVRLIAGSKGLVFPVKWDEPFGLAITESLYMGCPVFGTPYGSLPELIHKEVGFLSVSKTELIERMKDADSYSRKICHQYARDHFNSKVMAERYLEKYESVLNGHILNPNGLSVPRSDKKYELTD